MRWSWPQVIAVIIGELLVIVLTNWLLVLFEVPEVARVTALGALTIIAVMFMFRSPRA